MRPYFVHLIFLSVLCFILKSDTKTPVVFAAWRTWVDQQEEVLFFSLKEWIKNEKTLMCDLIIEPTDTRNALKVWGVYG